MPQRLLNNILGNNNLTPLYKLILIFLLKTAVKEKKDIKLNNTNTFLATTTTRQIAEGIAGDRASITKALNQLNDLGYIKWSKSQARSQPSTILVIPENLSY